MITLPGLLMGILLSTLYGVGFYFWRGGSSKRLLLFLLLAWVGFWIGHFWGEFLGWNFSSLGALRLGTATLTAALFLFIGHWIAPVEQRK